MKQVLLCGLCTLLLVCSDAERLIEQGQSAMAAGEYDQAMEFFARAYAEEKESAPLLHGLGLIFSLRAIGFAQAEQMLRRAISRGSTTQMRFDLLLFYLHRGQLAEARRLYSAAEMSLEKFYTPQMRAIRYGLDCMIKQDRRSRERLIDLPVDPLRDFLHLRCLQAAEIPGKEQGEHGRQLKTVWEGIPPGELRCLGLVSWPEELRPGNWSDLLTACRRDFPGQVALFREAFHSPQAPVASLIFTDQDVLPPYNPTFYRISLETGEEPRKEEEGEEESGDSADAQPSP
ncbi:MAG: hypothetical protein HS115_04305 [Spirochaetales bacterium]|nr:hypothetical protein [Spirochaetales bacterium]